MKRNLILFTMIVAVLGLTSIAAAQERDMERSFGTRFGPTQVGRPGYVTMLIRFSDQLELSSDQVEKLRSIATSFQKEAVQV